VIDTDLYNVEVLRGPAEQTNQPRTIGLQFTGKFSSPCSQERFVHGHPR
jgi:hypothetical protein